MAGGVSGIGMVALRESRGFFKTHRALPLECEG